MDDALQHRRDDVASSRISSDRVAEIVLKLVATQQELAQALERVALEVGVSDLLANQLTAAEEEIGRLSEKVARLLDRSIRAEAEIGRLNVDRFGPIAVFPSRIEMLAGQWLVRCHACEAPTLNLRSREQAVHRAEQHKHVEADDEGFVDSREAWGKP